MIRIAKLAAIGVASLIVIAIGAPLLFWLGRTQQPATGPLVVVDDDLLRDDPGVDVDGAS